MARRQHEAHAGLARRDAARGTSTGAGMNQDDLVDDSGGIVRLNRPERFCCRRITKL
ncbi:hypothetical protein [Marvinbryantia formatexigens]|nr:hypothetical protein [Marvinbryantia formatexigens]UWO26880.1 hypothetical protein NQ534_10720 [Marvinbryantia formatexigens DSM 14469]